MKGIKNLIPAAKLVLAIALYLTFGSAISNASDIYIAQNAAGANNGADCADAYAVTWFNTAANWGSGSGKIGPGTTAHLCGTFNGAAGSSMLTFYGSGTSGSPITLLWESGAVVQAPYFSASTYGINGQGATYVTLNGGTNGIIQNTANGTGLTNSTASVLVGGFGSNLQVENLSFLNVYVHLINDASGGGAHGLNLAGQSNVTVGPNNTFTQADVGIFDDWTSANSSNLTVYKNNFSAINQDMEFGFYPAGTFTNVYIYGNTATNWVNWDDPGNDYHHNFVHVFTNLPGASVTGNLQIYNNQVVGDMGSHATSLIYMENDNGGTGGTMGTWYIFNNVLSKTNANVPASTGIVALVGVNNGFLVNNTIEDAGGSGSNAYNCVNIYQTGWTLKNNIEVGCGAYIYQQGATIAASNNDYYGAASPQWIWHSSFLSTLASWQSNCSCDANSIGTNPILTGTYVPNAGSPVIGVGTNLSSLDITALNSDAVGVVRPSTAPWDMGAYQHASGSGTPTAPTTLAAIAH